MENCLLVCKSLLGALGIPFTQRFLKEKLMTHPEFPSLLSISDTFEQYGLESMAMRLNDDHLNEIPFPCIVQVARPRGHFFNVITRFSNQSVSLVDEKGDQKNISKLDFSKIWTGVCLLVEEGENTKEPEIEKRIIEQKIIKTLVSAGLIGFMGLIGIGLSENGLSGLFFGYFLLKILGLAISFVLLWYQQDKENPTLQRFCTGGGRSFDCNSILDSKDFQLLDGRINPSLLAFAYFLTGISMLAFSANSSFPLLLVLSIATLPVVIYSLYYQALVIKSWCRFCLFIQAVLTVEIITAIIIMSEFWVDGLSISAIAFFTFLFTGIILGGVWIKPLLEYQNELYKTKRELGKLKSNKQLFKIVLSQSKKILDLPEGLGILFKGKAAKNQVIKVCNPYCGPCSVVHPALKNLFDRGLIDLQILFAPTKGDMQKEKTIQHFLAIAEKDNQLYTRKALDDWYERKEKDYVKYAKKHPINQGLNQQDEKIKLMEDWCNRENIAYTPTLFINGYELPKEYQVEDLKYLLD